MIRALFLTDRRYREGPLEPLPLGAAKGSQLHRLSHEADVQSETASRDGACLLTASAYRMASGGAPANANVVRLWDAGSATLLRQWHFGGLGPDAALFAGQERVVALYRGEAYVYRTELCEPPDLIRRLVAERVTRELTREERSRYLGEAAPPAVSPGPPKPTEPSRGATPASPSTSPEHAQPPPPPVAVPAAETAAPKVGPAFDCSRAATPVETLICSDPELARLDVELDRTYRVAREKLQGQQRQKLVSEENAWIKGRAGCAGTPDMRGCVRTAYEERLAVLRSPQ